MGSKNGEQVVRRLKRLGMEEDHRCGGYVDDALHWRYSSARNYAGQAGLLPVMTDW